MGIDRSSGEPDEEPDRPREESRPGEPADYRESVQADLVAEALSGYKTARSASTESSRGSTDALHISMNVAFYPIDSVERHIHVTASTSMTGTLGHNALEIA